jgi:hypothetical protein
MVRRRCYRDVVRWATLLLLMLVACSDLRDFRATWSGPRVGDATPLRVGVQDGNATLAIDRIDAHGLAARLTVDGLVADAAIESLPGAEADVLAGITFSGAPLRVYLAFAPLADGRGDALVVVALYDDRRVEVRLLRGGAAPVYGIYALSEAVAVSAP